jgi:hypothetical protein
MTSISARTLTRVRPQVGVATTSSWRNDAACLGSDPDLFGDPEWERPSVKVNRIAYAKGVCNGTDSRPSCPVKAKCLAHATEHREQGVWGGTDDDQRKAMRPPEPATEPGSACGPQVGKDSGYQRHRRAHEPACAACQLAARTSRRNQDRARRARLADAA